MRRAVFCGLPVVLLCLLSTIGCGGGAAAAPRLNGSDNPPPVTPSATLSISPNAVTSGTTATLAWSTQGATSVTIDNGIGSVAASGSHAVTPQQTTTYTLTASNSAGTTTATAVITVTPAAAPTATLTATPTTVFPGDSTTLQWSTQGAATVTIDNGIGQVAASGSLSVKPPQTVTYTLTATNSAGVSTTAAVLVKVTPPPALSFTASPASIAAGSSATLTWNAQGATAVAIDNGIGTVAPTGSLTVQPAQTTTYTLSATNSAGVTTSATATVAVTPSITFTASPAAIPAGGSSTLTWSTQGASTVKIDNGIGSVGASGSMAVSPSQTTTYTLTASNATGSATATATVTVGAAVPVITFAAAPANITAGGSATLTWTTQNADTVAIDQGVGNVSTSGSATVTPADTTTYTITATNSSGSQTATATVAVAQSGIQHLVVVMMQNSSFDHLFGTYAGANGLDPTLPSYTQVDQAGTTVTPQLLTNLSPPDVNHTRSTYVAAWDNGKMDKYALTNGDMSMDYYDSTSNTVLNGSNYGVGTLWKYANSYALADNFFASAMASEPSNILYMVSASIGNGTTNAFGLPKLDACTAVELAKAPTASVSPPLTYPNVGDQLGAKGITWSWYQENFNTEQSGACNNYIPQENAFQYFQSTANGPHVLNYTTSDFQNTLTQGTLPAVMWVQPAPSHDMHPGSGNIGDAVLWLDNFIKAIKSSSAWPNTAIIVLWDESGGWYDHVAPPQLSGTIGLGARVPVLVISPFAKANYVSHQQMDFVSILRFIQHNWNLGKFTAADQAAREGQSGDLCDLLTTSCGEP